MGWPQVLGVTAPGWRQEEINSSLQAEPSPLHRTERYGGRGPQGQIQLKQIQPHSPPEIESPTSSTHSPLSSQNDLIMRKQL